jgi:hypothetical protein
MADLYLITLRFTLLLLTENFNKLCPKGDDYHQMYFAYYVFAINTKVFNDIVKSRNQY